MRSLSHRLILYKTPDEHTPGHVVADRSVGTASAFQQGIGTYISIQQNGLELWFPHLRDRSSCDLDVRVTRNPYNQRHCFNFPSVTLRNGTFEVAGIRNQQPVFKLTEQGETRVACLLQEDWVTYEFYMNEALHNWKSIITYAYDCYLQSPGVLSMTELEAAIAHDCYLQTDLGVFTMTELEVLSGIRAAEFVPERDPEMVEAGGWNSEITSEVREHDPLKLQAQMASESTDNASRQVRKPDKGLRTAHSRSNGGTDTELAYCPGCEVQGLLHSHCDRCGEFLRNTER